MGYGYILRDPIRTFGPPLTERQFRKVIGVEHIPKLLIALAASAPAPVTTKPQHILIER